MSNWLAFDSSTQSLSALLVESSGHVVAEESINFGRDLPQYDSPHGFTEDPRSGEIHSDPCMWLDALDLCLQRMIGNGVDFSKVQGISGAGQQHGTVYLNENWFPAVAHLNPAKSLASQLSESLSRATSPIWMDGSTSEECREISNTIGGDLAVCELSGSIPIERFSGPQIRRFFKRDPKGYERTARIHLVSSFIASVLSGKDAPIDLGDGAGMNLLNLAQSDWDDGLLEATAPHLRAKLPATAPSSTIVGEVSPYFQRRYKIPSTAKVVAFTGDNPSSLIGMGASQPGSLVISLGTSDTLFASMPEPMTDPNGFGHVFGNPFGGFMSLVCFRNGSLTREKVKDQLQVEWSAFDRGALAATPPGNDGNGMVPFFGPEITPRCNLTTPLLFGSPEFQQNPTPTQYIRACLEGQFINMRLQTEWMKIQPKRILLTGGASQNDGIAQTVANVFGTPVARLASSGSVAIGGILRAAQAVSGECHELEKQLCAPVAESFITPEADTTEAYHLLARRFAKALSSV